MVMQFKLRMYSQTAKLWAEFDKMTKKYCIDVTVNFCDLLQQHLERRMGRLENLLQAIAQHHNIHVEDEPY